MLTIKKNFEFKRVLSKGKYFNSNNLAIYFFPNRLNLLRFGFAVGKKAGKAVERNRIKRIIRESARLTTISFNKGYDLVFVWKNKVSADNVKYIDIKKEVEYLYHKIQKEINNEKISIKSN